MPNAVKPVRQRVQQEAPDEFAGGQRHHLVLVVVPIIAPTEGDPAAGERDEPTVGDCDAVRVAAEIGQNRSGACEGPLGVNDPLDTAQLGKALCKSSRVRQSAERTKER